MRTPDYSAQRVFVALAQPAAPLGAFIIGYIIIDLVFGFVVGGLYSGTANDEPVSPSALQSFVLLSAYGSLAVAAFVITRVLHGRSPLTLFGDWNRVISDFLVVTRGLAIFYVVFYLLPFWNWEGVDFQRSLAAWVALLPFSIMAIFIQTASEEVVYRGYLQQGLSARYDNPLIWMVAPAILFGLVHYDPNLSPALAVDYMIWTGLFGLAAADLTARTGSLGAAMALHFVTNFIVTAIFAQTDIFAGFALILLPESSADLEWSLWSSLIGAFTLWMSWMVCRIAIRR